MIIKYEIVNVVDVNEWIMQGYQPHGSPLMLDGQSAQAMVLIHPDFTPDQLLGWHRSIATETANPSKEVQDMTNAQMPNMQDVVKGILGMEVKPLFIGGMNE